MDRKSLTLAAGLVALAIVVAAAGAFLLVLFLPPGVLVPAGTVVEKSAILTWVVHFDALSRGQIVGAAEANLTPEMASSPGWWGLSLANGTLTAPPIAMCPKQTSLPSESQGFNYSVWPGPYTVFWGFCMTYLPTSITVTQSIRFVAGG